MSNVDILSKKTGMNKNTLKSFFLDEPDFEIVKATTTEESIMAGIEYFTKLNDEELEECLKKSSYFSKYDDYYRVDFDDRRYFFRKIDPYFDGVIKNELCSNERYGNCCEAAIDFAYMAEGDGKVVIGYLRTGNEKILHAVFVNNGRVWDYTKNLIMNEEEYYQLTNFQVINEVDGNDIIREMPLIGGLNFILLKFYLLYRDEVMKDLDKNKTLIKEHCNR